jgi:glycerol-3-phosphate dehydrogenase
VVVRRLRTAWFEPQECADSLTLAATLMAREFGWDDARIRLEMDAVASAQSGVSR